MAATGNEFVDSIESVDVNQRFPTLEAGPSAENKYRVAHQSLETIGADGRKMKANVIVLKSEGPTALPAGTKASILFCPNKKKPQLTYHVQEAKAYIAAVKGEGVDTVNGNDVRSLLDTASDAFKVAKGTEVDVAFTQKDGGFKAPNYTAVADEIPSAAVIDASKAKTSGKAATK